MPRVPDPSTATFRSKHLLTLTKIEQAHALLRTRTAKCYNVFYFITKAALETANQSTLPLFFNKLTINFEVRFGMLKLVFMDFKFPDV